MIDLEVTPARKTLTQTAIILNVSKITVRRMADNKIIDWSAGQITTESIKRYMHQTKGRRKYDETDEEIEKKSQQADRKITGRRIISTGIE